MRGIFSLVGLLVVLAIVGLLVKKQMSTQIAVPAAPGMPAVSADAPPRCRAGRRSSRSSRPWRARCSKPDPCRMKNKQGPGRTLRR